ncbi:MAG: proteasome accessory factor PafA2 family protein [Candidatus Tectomicrobia bacterium]|nr:proteasome accessory factor PafA2 family protein [Candidatus Tectomicrobia bacterium]
MSIPKIVGIEQEYAITVNREADLDYVEASYEIVQSYHEGGELLEDHQAETPTNKMSQGNRGGSSKSVQGQGNSNRILTNGSRYYVDHAHPEFSTAECLTAQEVVAFDKAGECILNMSREYIRRASHSRREIGIYKNNSDGKGNSFGTHENYLLEARSFTILFPEKATKYLIPFLVTRQIFCGAGKVGSENGSPEVAYQISQRADFFETIFHIKTMSSRPIINTRDEPHADRERFRRLHLIVGDANMSEYSAYLKIGTTQIVLKMIEDYACKGDLSLENPVEAIKAISHDPTCRARVRLNDGRSLTAIEIQQEFFEMATTYFAQVQPDEIEADIMVKWGDVLQRLQEDPMQLSREVDWVIKKWLLEYQIRKKPLSWRSERIKQMDIQYHSIDQKRGLFYILQANGMVERIFEDDALISWYVREPPESTRAYFRGKCLANHFQTIDKASWDAIYFKHFQKSGREDRNGRILLLDPQRGTRHETETLLKQSRNVEELLSNFQWLNEV